MKRQKVNLANMYQKAAHLSEAEQEIAKLQSEVQRLRSEQNPQSEEQLRELREQLTLATSIQELSISRIKTNPDQPRKTFSEESIQSMAQTLNKDGQLHPIIVIPFKEIFKLFDGERRWRAANKLGWETLKAVVMPCPQDLHRKALLTTLYREDLNPLDKAEALIKEISNATGITPEQTPRILSTVVRRLEYQKKMKEVVKLVNCNESEQANQLKSLELNNLEQSILQVILGLGLNPASVCSNDFRMLSLFNDLQNAIRQLNLNASHAMILQRLSPKKLNLSEKLALEVRTKAIQDVTKNKLSLIETKKLVCQIIENNNEFKNNKNRTKLKINNLIGQIKALSLADVQHSQLKTLYQELKLKLVEIEGTLDKENLS